MCIREIFHVSLQEIYNSRIVDDDDDKQTRMHSSSNVTLTLLTIISILAILKNSAFAWTQFNSSIHHHHHFRRNLAMMASSSSTSNSSSSWKEESPYGRQFGEESQKDDVDDDIKETTTTAINYYNASCYCGRVKYQVRGEPESAKFCHCRGCQQLHGAPFEWVSSVHISDFIIVVFHSFIFIFQPHCIIVVVFKNAYCTVLYCTNIYLFSFFFCNKKNKVCIFHKYNVKFGTESSLNYLYFYSDSLDQGWDSTQASKRVLPVKVSCSHCRTPIADEGRHMWLAFATLFGFTIEGGGGSGSGTIPNSFRHTDHLFYGQRCVNLDGDENDDEKNTIKWVGHRKKSPQWTTKPK